MARQLATKIDNAEWKLADGSKRRFGVNWPVDYWMDGEAYPIINGKTLSNPLTELKRMAYITAQNDWFDDAPRTGNRHRADSLNNDIRLMEERGKYAKTASAARRHDIAEYYAKVKQ